MSDSDEEYDPAEVAIPALAPTSSALTAATTTIDTSSTTTTAAERPILSRSDLFNTSAPTLRDGIDAPAGSHGVAHAASASSGHTRVESAEGGYRLRSDMKGRVRCLALNPAGTTLCAGSEDGQLCMWDFTTHLKTHRVAPTRVLTPFVNRISGLQPIIALTYAKDGSYLVTCQDGDSPALVRASGEQLGYCAMGERGLMDVVQCRGHRAPVTCTAPHHANAAVFLTGSQDGTVRLWSSATFKQRSTYAVKHGSGQVTETHVVESVATLRSFRSGDIFASGGQDGIVQLWDSRVKYRPGGSLAAVDMFADTPSSATRDAFVDKHVGGLLELQTPSIITAAAAAAAASLPNNDHALAVRVGSVIKTIDLRALSSSTVASTAGVVHEVAHGLPYNLDTTALAVGRGGGAASSSLSSGLLTSTSRAGFHNVAGGHVVQYALHSFAAALEPTMVWRAGKADEDVLCACADGSRADGCVYAGLSSGEVVVHGAFVAVKGDPQPLETWLETRPTREGRDRVVGEKAGRLNDMDVMGDLF